MQRRTLGSIAGVAADQMQRMDRNIDPVPALIFQDQEFPRVIRHLHDHKADVATDTVFLMHYR